MAPTRRVSNVSSARPGSSKKRKAGRIGPMSSVKSKKLDKQIGQSALLAKHKKVKDKIKEIKKGKVKVPKLLRKQINQILDVKDVFGSGELQCFGTVADMNTNNYTKQKVFALPLPRIGTETQSGLLFDPYFWQYVMARLFNGRLSQGTGLSVGAWSNLLVQENGAGPYSWSNFDRIDGTSQSAVAMSKISVQKAYAVITMKNNTTRSMHLKMYVCQPKYQRKDPTGLSSGIGGVAVSDWRDCLDAETAAKASDGNGFTNQTKAGAINVGGSVTVETMYAKPTACKLWNKMWNVEEFSITLEPGQIHKHTVNGDAVDIDFSKTQAADGAATVFNRIQKFNRYVFFTGVQELAYDSVVGGVRAQNNTTTVGGSEVQAQYLIFETRIHCRIKMPENTGGSIDLAAANFPSGVRTFTLGNRRRCYFVDTFTNSASTTNAGFEMNVDDNTTTQQTR